MASGLHARIVQMWRDEPWHCGEACSCSRLEFSAALHDQLPAKYATIFEGILVYSSPLRHCLEYYATMLLRADFERGYLSDSESLGSSKSSGNSLPRSSKAWLSGAGLVRSPFFAPSASLMAFSVFGDAGSSPSILTSWNSIRHSTKNYTITITIIVWISV